MEVYKMKKVNSYRKLTELGCRIEHLRKHKPDKDGMFLRRDELAEKIGISEKTFRNWILKQECHTTTRVTEKIDALGLAKIADLYGVSVDYLLGRHDGTTHDIDFIMKKTGLSEQAIYNLMTLNEGSTEHAPYCDYLSGLLTISKIHGQNPYLIDIASNTFSIIGTTNNNTIEDPEVKEMIIAGLKLQLQQAFLNYTDDYISSKT